MENEMQAILSDAQALVSDQCSQLVLSISERDYVGDERKTFLHLTTAQLLGASLDLRLEIVGNDPEPLKRFVTMRLRAKYARDTGAELQKTH